MQAMIQNRNVPEVLHRRLKARAAIEGLSMSRNIPRETEKALERPSRREFLDTIRSQPELGLNPSPAEILRRERESRRWFRMPPAPSNSQGAIIGLGTSFRP